MKRKPRDKYSKAIRFLREHSNELRPAWFNPNGHKAGCLFLFATKSGRTDGKFNVGCLTMIRGSSGNYWQVENRPDLTHRVAEDCKLPADSHSMTLKHLSRFAYWQRILDKELGRPV